MGRLDGKVALISGGARGQGAVETELFVKEGAKVIFGDVLDDEGRKVEARVRELGGEATYVHLDVTSEDDWRSAVDLAESQYGLLNVLVNNAGIARAHTAEEVSVEAWDEIMDVNGKGVMLGTKYSIPALQRAGGGSIINISSIAGIVGRTHASPIYSASKGAVRVMTKHTAMRHAEDNIRCNSIHPGPIDTPMLRRADAPVDPESRALDIPLGRLGTSEDVAFGVLYLASDESSFITGIELVIDGGVTAR